MECLRTKNVASYFVAPMVDKNNPESYKTGEAVTDTAYYKDGAGAWSALAITDTFSEIGATGMYEIDLTAAELNHDQVIIKMTAANSQSNLIVVSLIPAPANIQQISDDATAAGNLELDYDGTGYAKANSTIGTATVLTTKTGFSLAATGLDAIGQAATGVVEIAKAIWDRVLTGGTHNIATSAGRRLRALQDFQGYEDGAIWVDTVNGVAGTTLYENGTVENPVDTLADALTINAALPVAFNKFRIANGSTITLSANSDNYTMKGQNWTLALNGQSIANAHFSGAAVSGIGTGAGYDFHDCNMGNCTLADGDLKNCGLAGDITCSAAGTYYLDQCFSGVAGTATPSIDFGAAVANTNINFRHYSGGIEIKNMGTTGTDNMSLEGHGQYILNANCDPSNSPVIAVRGHFRLTDNVAGGFVAGGGTISTLANVPPNFGGLGITGGVIDNVTTVGSVTGAVGSVTGAVGSVAGNVDGNVSGSVASVAGAVGSVTGAVGSVAGNVDGNVTGSIGSLAAQAKTDVNTEVDDIINVDANSEVSSIPAASAPIGEKIAFTTQVARNKLLQTATTATISKDDGTAVGTATVSDDGTTFTRGKFS